MATETFTNIILLREMPADVKSALTCSVVMLTPCKGVNDFQCRDCEDPTEWKLDPFCNCATVEILPGLDDQTWRERRKFIIKFDKKMNEFIG